MEPPHASPTWATRCSARDLRRDPRSSFSRLERNGRVQRIASATVGHIGRPPVEKNIVMNEIDRMDCSNNPFWRTMLTVRNGPSPISRITGRIGSTVRRRPRTLQRPRANSPAEGRKNRLRFAIANAVRNDVYEGDRQDEPGGKVRRTLNSQERLFKRVHPNRSGNSRLGQRTYGKSDPAAAQHGLTYPPTFVQEVP